MWKEAYTYKKTSQLCNLGSFIGKNKTKKYVVYIEGSSFQSFKSFFLKTGSHYVDLASLEIER